MVGGDAAVVAAVIFGNACQQQGVTVQDFVAICIGLRVVGVSVANVCNLNRLSILKELYECWRNALRNLARYDNVVALKI